MADAQTDFGTRLPEKIASNPDFAKNIGANFLFKISGDGGGTWTVNLKDKPGVYAGEEGTADVTIEVAADDYKAVSENPAAAMQLYFTGKLKVEGNVGLATKLQALLG